MREGIMYEILSETLTGGTNLSQNQQDPEGVVPMYTYPSVPTIGPALL